MSKIKTLGLAGLAVLAVSVVAVASASAALPEFKTTTFPVSFTSANVLPQEPTLHSSVLETVINCKMSSDTGKVTSTKEVKEVKVKYTECKEGTSTNKCTTTGKAAGEIETKVLKGRIGYVLPRSGIKVGTELEPEAGAVFAEFTCAGFAGETKVEGCTIGEATPLNTSSTTGTLTFREVAKKQEWVEIEGGTHKPCKQTVSALGGFAKGEGWITDTETETFSAAVELKA